MRKLIFLILLLSCQTFADRFDNEGFLLVAKHNLTIGDRVQITGDKIGAENINVNSESNLACNVLCQGDISMTNRSVITEDVILEGSTNLYNGASISGTVTESDDVDLPIYHLSGFANYSQQDITVSGTQTLVSGSYKEIIVKAGATLILESGGHYKCTNITIGDGASILVDGSGDFTSFLVLGVPTFGNNIEIKYSGEYDPNKFQFSVAGVTTINLGNGFDFRGKFLAPQSTVTLKAGSTLEVMVFASEIIIENECQLSFTPSSDVVVEETPEPILSEPTYSSGILDFSVYGTDHVELRDRVYSVYGTVGSGNTVTIGNDCTVNGTVKAVGSITKGDRSVINGSELGNVRTVFETVPSKSVTTGTTDFITLNDDNTLHQLTPGSYNDFFLRARSRVQFSTGVYNFSTFKLEPDVEVVFDVTAGPVYINVEGSFDIESRHAVNFVGDNINPIDVKFYTNHSGELYIRPDSPFYGMLTAPNADIHVYSRRDCKGAFYGKSVYIEPDVKVQLPPKLHDFWHSEWAFAPIRISGEEPFGFNPGVTHYKAVVPTDVSELGIELIPTDEKATVKVNGVEGVSNINLTGSSTTIEVELSLEGNETKSYYYVTFIKSSNPYVFVDASANGANNGSSWGNAYTSLQSAITDGNTSGKEIWVADGIYKPGTSKDDNFTLLPNNELIGGFVGNEAILRTSKNNRVLFETTLSGDLSENDGENFTNRSDNTFNVIEMTGRAKAKYIIDGFSIYGGYANGSTDVQKNGGGIYCPDYSLTMKNIIFKDNFAAEKGGALYIAGGEYVSGDKVSLLNNKADFGGALYADETSLSMKNTLLVYNEGSYGGALYTSNSSLLSINNTIYGNTASSGGALYTLDNSNTIFKNTIIWGNSSSIKNTDSDISFKNCSIEGGVGSNGVDLGDNLNAAPSFMDVSSPFGKDGKLHTIDDGFELKGESPLVNSAENASAPDDDIIGLERPIGPTAAIGAYEEFPRLHNIWHSEWAFAPKFSPDIFEYKAVVPTSTSSLEIEATPLYSNFNVEIVGAEDNIVTLSGNTTIIEIIVTQVGTSLGGHYFLTVQKNENPYIYVDKNASGENNGTSWVNAYNNIYIAVKDAEESGKEIWVADGRYPVSQTADNGLIVTPNIELIGGFGSGEEPSLEFKTSRLVYNTILTGDLSNNDANFENMEDNTSHVVYLTGRYDAKYKIDGFIMSNGYANREDHYKGGGIYLTDGKLTLLHSLLSNNYSKDNGGGLYITANSQADINDCGFYNNKSTNGAGLYLSNNSYAHATNVLMASNQATDGGAIYSDRSSFDLINNTIYNNSGIGGAAKLVNSTAKISNSIIWSNGTEFSSSSSNITFASSDVKGGVLAYGTDDGFNKDTDPLFVNPGNPLGEDGKLGSGDDGLILQAYGQVQNTADYDIAPQYDILQIQRDASPAMGCYEPQPSSDGSVKIGIVTSADEFTNSVYPNLPIITGLTKPVINSMGRGEYGRVIQISVKADDHIKSSGYVKVYGKLPDGTKASEGLRIPFTRAKKANGKYYYQSYTTSFGKKILFTNVKEMEGEYTSAYVIYTIDDNVEIHADKNSFKK